MQHVLTHPGAARAQALLNEAQQARQARLAQAAARAQADRHPTRSHRLTFFLVALRRRLHLA
ncbi:hypothetical protein [Deinococcus sp. 6GRE01]|uniref:hypothetical protein n=1 Tax=Deinococcus sp. 6GRE01 TaxID=2745873 RepID=UPI001E329EDA|nr:hypothetical protein [Deinococcus sp. 6GRE01]MCD0158301.1 hypothetical protein [Deinococcus sp. 6GRE01]